MITPVTTVWVVMASTPEWALARSIQIICTLISTQNQRQHEVHEQARCHIQANMSTSDFTSSSSTTTTTVLLYTTLPDSTMAPIPQATTSSVTTSVSSAGTSRCEAYRYTVAIESVMIGVVLVCSAAFCLFKSKRWKKIGAASRDPEVAEMQKTLAEQKDLLKTVQCIGAQAN